MIHLHIFTLTQKANRAASLFAMQNDHIAYTKRYPHTVKLTNRDKHVFIAKLDANDYIGGIRDGIEVIHEDY